MNKSAYKILNTALVCALPVLMFSCRAKDNYQGLEFSPNMYHSVAYEPLKQITDKEAGMWVSNRADGKGEYYNSNEFNPHRMNMREPVAGTVFRNKDGFLPYRIKKDDWETAAKNLNPLPDNDAVLSEGEILYGKFCQPCHGLGDGQGPVGKVMMGVPAYNKGRLAKLSEGHIFHAITFGKGRMGAHGSQLNQKERWQIVRYVQTLQQK